jgi:hypothetical protein
MVGHVACMRAKRDVYRIFVRKSEDLGVDGR